MYAIVTGSSSPQLQYKYTNQQLYIVEFIIQITFKSNSYIYLRKVEKINVVVVMELN